MMPYLISRSLRAGFLLFLLVSVSGCFGESGDNSDSAGANPSDAIPDQDSFSISAEELTVQNAANEDGLTTMVNIRLGDNLNTNNIPDGTIVNFIAEGGVIDSSCRTEDGGCSVQWESQNPRPGDFRVSVLAWAEGTETFQDLNSNGVFDDEVPDIQIDDVSEPFLDANEDGTRDSNEVFIEFPAGVTSDNDQDAVFDGPDGLYSGPDCEFPGQCADNERVFIFSNIVLVMGSNTGGTLEFTDCSGNVVTGTLNPGTHCFRATDSNGNPMPPGASINYNADAIDVTGPATYPNTNVVPEIAFELTADGTSDTGTLTVTVDASGGPTVSGSIDTAD